MTELRISTERQRELFAELQRLVTERARAEISIPADRAARLAEAEQQRDARIKERTATCKEERSGSESDFLTQLAAARQTYERQSKAIAADEEDKLDDLRLRRTQALEATRKSWELEREQISQVHSRETKAEAVAWGEYQQLVAQHRQRLDSVRGHFEQVLDRRGMSLDDIAAPEASEQDSDDFSQAFVDTLDEAHKALRRLVQQFSARFLEDGWPVLLFLVLCGAYVYPSGNALGWSNWLWVAVCGGAALLTTVTLCMILRPARRRSTLRAAPTVRQLLVDASSYLDKAFAKSKADSNIRRHVVDNRRDQAIIEADNNWAGKKSEIDDEFDAREHHERQRLAEQRQTVEREWKSSTKALNVRYRPLLNKLEQAYDADMARLQQEFELRSAEINEQFDEEWRALVDRWTQGVTDFENELEAMNEYCQQRFPPWQDADWTTWRPRDDEELAALRFGRYTLDLEHLEEGAPQHADLQLPRTTFSAPALLSFPLLPSLLLKAHGDGRDVAVDTIQNIMLRMLTSFPPGKVRFTIIDPTGLGQNFSAFMHLADFDERLVANRIWTETTHIQQRLADLTEHMEKVIQKYLRNEFESIQQYNRFAGEVAEPFQILVVANFPANFSEEAARRLVSIASSGARCGVYTLISVDGNLSLPRNFDLADLQTHAGAMEWDAAGGFFRFEQEALRPFPVELETPPDDALFSDAVRSAGQLAKESSRVEVPFSFVAPKEEEYWTGDTRGEIEVPLGRAGATKLQYLQLGQGTSQHVLISGKTGSGKSTLLHALITNLALYYSPNEIQLYLVDFKKGVEFKPYATQGLPHARVIAIESEREFGMSVLQRLDDELRRRGDLLRGAGVQDIKGYRDANPDAVMPRILLIIDEFQEFFVKDDRIASDAGLLLDRLVRQGRAFGIHVLLGSQTLAGAYSLARSTIGQMAVRIALQCSEGDAHLILSEDNTAARLLNRPGEAIYNDANGMFEGNHPFQVVWLPDHERENYLEEMTRLMQDRGIACAPPIVFEGNVPADAAGNVLLGEALAGAGREETNLAPSAWLGASVAIKDPTSISFQRQSGSNLLIVGQQEEMAAGVMATALIGVASHLPLADAALRPRFLIFDGARSDSAEAGFWTRFAKALPLDARIIRPRDAAAAILEAHDELEQRMERNDDEAPPIFLFIYNIARFRDLKLVEDFQFSFDDNKADGADKMMAKLLREGPTFGVHAVVWCDSHNNLVRFLDRHALRDLELRVLFQMSGNDSANLMDSPAAARLGANRAFFYNEELGESEKFRPYGPPDADWLQSVGERFAQRGAIGVLPLVEGS